MKKVIYAAAISLALASSPAFAADLPSRKEAPVYVAPPPAFSWSGFYGGVHLGAGIGNGTWADPVYMSGGAFLGGAGFGYNWQLAPNWVVGLETDGSYRGPVSPGWNGPGFVSSSDIGYIGTFRPRVGYALNQFLFYVTGGLAYGNVIAPKSYGGLSLPGFVGVRINNNDTLLPGWTVGGGLEYALNANWSIKAEYLYAQLAGSTPKYVAAVSVLPIAICTKTSEHIVRFGVNYHFNWAPPIPVLAKY